MGATHIPLLFSAQDESASAKALKDLSWFPVLIAGIEEEIGLVIKPEC